MIARCITLLLALFTVGGLAPVVHVAATLPITLAQPLHAQITVSPEPIVEIGGSIDDPENQLFQVADAVRLPDGRIAVANTGSNEIRIYDGAGRLERSLGRQGSGPGEFRGIRSLHLLSSDSLAVFDRAHQRITVYSADGELSDDLPVPGDDVGHARDMIPLADGRWVSVHEDAPDARGDLWRRTARFVLRDPELRVVRTVSELPAEIWVRWEVDGRGVTRMTPLTPRLWHAPLGACVAVAGGDEAGVRLISPTGEVRTLPVDARPVAMTEAVVDEWLDYLAANMPEDQRGMVRRMMRDIPTTDSVPVVHQVEADPRGRVWVQRYEAPIGWSRRWDVLDLEGTHVASVELPEAYRVMDIGTGYLLGLRSGPLDMEILAMHEIERNVQSPVARAGGLCGVG